LCKSGGAVDTTLQPKNIVFLTDLDLLQKSHEKIVMQIERLYEGVTRRKPLAS
jgi:hypothetical protein